MLLYGASGHARVICSALESHNIPINGLFDDSPRISFLGEYKVLGPYNADLNPNEPIIISIGDNATRRSLSDKIKHQFGTCISASATCDRLTDIKEGTVVLHGAIIQRGAIIGKHVIVNTSSSIDHDCVVKDYVHISPGVTLCGAVEVGEGTHIGAGAIVIPNIKIGKWCVIGAGTVIVSDIPDNSWVVGVPGKVIKKINKYT